MNRFSLRLRLAAFGAIVVLVSLGSAAFGLTQLFWAHVERRSLVEMEIQLEQVVAGLVMGPSGLELGTPLSDPRFERPYGGRYWQVVADDLTIRSRSLWDASLGTPDTSLAEGAAQPFRVAGPGGQALFGLRQAIQLPTSLGGGRVAVMVAMDAAELVDARNAFAADLPPYVFLLVALLVAGQVVQLTVGLRPLARIGERVAALRAGEEKRMGELWPAEVRPLAGEIDSLIQAREAATEKARFRAADLAHGLKTPLQALLGQAGHLRARGEVDSANVIEDVVGVMQAHVERELARARVAMQAAHARARLADVAAQIVEVLKRTPQGSVIAWGVDIPSHLEAAIDPTDLAEAVGALAENAMRHASGVVEITAGEGDAQIFMYVDDDGPGIPEDAIHRVARRGERLDESAGGAGFGLPIAADIAEAAGGALSLENRMPGFRAILKLPAAADRP